MSICTYLVEVLRGTLIEWYKWYIKWYINGTYISVSQDLGMIMVEPALLLPTLLYLRSMYTHATN